VSEPAPAPAPAPVPTPAPAPVLPTPAPVLPTPAPATIPPIDLSNIDLSNLDLSNIDLSNINLPSIPPPAPEPVEPIAPPLNPPGSGFDPVEDVMSYQFYNPVEPVAPVAPEPAVGIETLAPDDFTAPVTPPFSPSEQMGSNALEPQDGPLPDGIVLPVNTRAEAVEAGIPMPDGSQFNLENLDLGGFEVDPEIIQNALAEAGIETPATGGASTFTPNLDAGLTLGNTLLTEPTSTASSFQPDGSEFNLENLDLSGFEVDPEIIQNALAEAGIETPATGGASTFTPNLDAGLTLGDTLLTEPTSTASSFQPEAGGFTLTPEQQAAVDAAIGSGSFSLINDSYGFTDGQQDAAGVIPGAGAAVNATTDASTNPNAGQGWYENMTDEQREAYDAWIASGGLANIPGGTIDLGAIGGGTVNIPDTTPRPVVEAIQNLTVNRDPTLAGNVSAATQYGLTGAPPVQAPSTNPFQRPETQQGIGSLAGGG
jgi:hypothetical protein